MINSLLNFLLWLVGLPALVAGVVTFIMRRLFEHALTKKLEEHKNELKAASDVDLERLKADLKRDADERLEHIKHDLKRQADAELEVQRAQLRQIADAYAARASSLYQRRLDVIVDGYALLPGLVNALQAYTNPVKAYAGGLDEEQRGSADQRLKDDLFERYSKFRTFFAEHALFFDAETRRHIDEFDAFVDNTLWSHFPDGSNAEARTEWIKTHQQTLDILPNLMRTLASRFGALIGVEQDVQGS